MGMPLSGDTEVQQGRPPLGPASDDVDRPQPTAAPGSDAAGGWVKIGAVADGGWGVIDDVSDDGAAVWRQT